MKITLNPAICDGFGYCAEMLPGMITLDEWGFPIIADEAVPDALEKAARQTVKFCPRRALHMTSEPKQRP